MSKAAFISNDLGNLASFTALYVTSQRGHFPLLIRLWARNSEGVVGGASINVID
jgi:hypothetical protein